VEAAVNVASDMKIPRSPTENKNRSLVGLHDDRPQADMLERIMEEALVERPGIARRLH